LWALLPVLVALLPVCASGQAGGPILNPGLDPPTGYDFSPLTGLIQDAVDNTPLQGAALLVVKDGQPVYEAAFGRQTPDEAVAIASASKWLTAAVIMTLVDDGAIALDDPVAAYLPSFGGSKRAITIRQLLAHTSGLPAYHPCLDDPSGTLAGCAEQIATGSLVAEPGTRFHYGGVSFQVAGRVAEVASGKPWATLFEEKIKGPLGMNSTTYGTSENPVLGGGARSTLHDYGRFLQMLLDDGAFDSRQVISASSVQEMHRDQTFGAAIAYTPQQDHRGYGLGEWRDVVVDQGNALQVSCQGDNGFSPWIDRERNLVGVFATEDGLGNVHDLVPEIQRLIRDTIDAAQARQPPLEPRSVGPAEEGPTTEPPPALPGQADPFRPPGPLGGDVDARLDPEPWHPDRSQWLGPPQRDESGWD